MSSFVDRFKMKEDQHKEEGMWTLSVHFLESLRGATDIHGRLLSWKWRKARREAYWKCSPFFFGSRLSEGGANIKIFSSCFGVQDQTARENIRTLWYTFGGEEVEGWMEKEEKD
jgi:hypothetical protein